jgi:hypothetical protein
VIAIGIAPGIRNVTFAVIRVTGAPAPALDGAPPSQGTLVGKCLDIELLPGRKAPPDADVATLRKKALSIGLELSIFIERAVSLRDPVTILGLGPPAHDTMEPEPHVEACRWMIEGACAVLGLRNVVSVSREEYSLILGSKWRQARFEPPLHLRQKPLYVAAGTALAAAQKFHVQSLTGE